MLKRLLKCTFLTFLLLCLTGCWNYRELEEQAIVSAIGIDVAGDEFIVSVEVLNPAVNAKSQSGSSSNEAAITIFQTKEKTVREALTKVVTNSPYRLYIGHMDLLVIGEEAAKKGMYQFLDFFMRDTESRKIFTTVVAKGGRAIDVLKILDPLNNVTGNSIRDSFNAMKNYYGTVSNSSFDEMMMCLFTRGRNTTTAAVEIKGSIKEGSNTDNLSNTEAKGHVEIFGTAVFKGDKLIGYLDEKKAIFYAMIRQKVTTTTVSFKCDDEKDSYGSVVIDNVSLKLEMKVKDDFPIPVLKIIGASSLTELNCDIDLKKPENLIKIEMMVNKEIKKEMLNTIKTVQELNSDIFGFEEQLWRNKNKYWKTIKDKWDDIFPRLKPEITVKIELERTSSVAETVKSRGV